MKTQEGAKSAKSIEALREERLELKQQLLQFTEERVERSFTDRAFDREHEKIQLIGGLEITLAEVEENRKILARQLQKYEVTFPKDYYREINRLNKWNKTESNLHQKPPIVGRYTNEIIYQRFSKEVLPYLQTVNPYIGFGLRMHMHFQWLSEEGREQLLVFIDDAISVMKECDDWDEFRLRHAKKFGLSYQLSMPIEL